MAKRRLHYDPDKDYYQILGIDPAANREQIQQQYRELAKKYHPDRNPERVAWATEQFQRVSEAYNVLNNPGARSTYDDLRWLHHKPRFGTEQRHQAQDYGWAASASPRTTPPGYHTVRIERPGKWLVPLGLGFMRPFYAAVVDLIRSPYRYLLAMLGFILIANLLFITAQLRDERIPATSTPASAPFIDLNRCSASVTFTMSSLQGQENEGYQANIAYYSPHAAQTRTEGLLLRVDALHESKATIQASYPVSLALQQTLVNHETYRIPQQITSRVLPAGQYVLRWDAALPEAEAGYACALLDVRPQ